MSDRPPRVRPWVRTFAIVAFIILLPVAAVTTWDYVEARRLAALVDGIRASGEPVSLARVVRRAEPGDAARYYDAAAALLDTSGLYEAQGIMRRLDFPHGEGMDALVADIRAWLAKNGEAEALLARATGRDFGAYAPGTDYSYRTDRLLGLAALADLRAIERNEAGDPEGAARAMLQQMEIARPLQATSNDLGVLTGAMVIGRAISSLGPILERQPSGEVLVALQNALARQDRDGVIEQALLSERAFILGQYWDPGSRWFTTPAREPLLRPGGLILRPYVMHLVTRQVQTMNALLETARKPWPQRLDVPPLPGGPPRGSGRLFLARASHSQWATINAHRTRTRYAAAMLAGIRTAITAVAVERYRQAHNGSLPTQLESLVPQLPAVPIDPFSGRPVLYQASGAGYTVYSLGANRSDDGGKGAGTQLRRRWGANQAQDEPLDIGIRVSAGEQPRR